MAEDLTAETFLRLWESSRWRKAVSVKGYLLAIARNLFLHELRHIRRYRPLTDAVARAGSLLKEVEVREEFRLVMNELGKLPEVDRSALLMRVNDGLPY